MQRIEVVLNGDPTAVDPSTTVASMLETRGFNRRYAAVAINEQFVPRTQHPTQLLQPGDRVEVLMPFAGG
ncbi:MAG: sulfur carrier protein ThiS [Thermoanaerobaculia bacterium]